MGRRKPDGRPRWCRGTQPAGAGLQRAPAAERRSGYLVQVTTDGTDESCLQRDSSHLAARQAAWSSVKQRLRWRKKHSLREPLHLQPLPPLPRSPGLSAVGPASSSSSASAWATGPAVGSPAEPPPHAAGPRARRRVTARRSGETARRAGDTASSILQRTETT